MSQTHHKLSVIIFLLCLFILSGCVPRLAVREIVYRPSPSDPYHLWQAYITDSGLLYLCGSVDNDREGMEGVHRVYNLELRLEETLDPLKSKEIQVIQVDDHPSLQTTKGYLSDLCQFDEKRETRRPGETGWTEIFMDNWDEGFMKVYASDLETRRLPTPPTEPRVVLYPVLDTDPPEYLLIGQLRDGGPQWKILLVLGSGHITTIW